MASPISREVPARVDPYEIWLQEQRKSYAVMLAAAHNRVRIRLKSRRDSLLLDTSSDKREPSPDPVKLDIRDDPFDSDHQRGTEMLFELYGFKSRSIDSYSDLPKSMRPLAIALNEVALGRGIISTNPESSIWTVLSKRDDPAMFSCKRSRLGTAPTGRFAKSVVRHAIANHRFKRPGGHWNHNVNNILLNEAIRTFPGRNKLQYGSIARAEIEDACIPPRIIPSFTKKAADFAYIVRFDEEEGIELLQGQGFLSQTRFPPLALSPPAVSFVVSVPGGDRCHAQMRLNSWAFAQVAKLNYLRKRAGTDKSEEGIPALPFVLIHGSEWSVQLLESGKEGSMLWRRGVIGDVSTIRGVFQVVLGLQHLMRWAEQVYAPWMVIHIVRPLIALAQAARESKL